MNEEDRGERQRRPSLPLVAFTDEQEIAFRDGLHVVQIALLEAIAREAGRVEAFDGPSNIARLTGALTSLRLLASGVPPGGGWFAYAPGTEPAFEADEFDDFE